LIAAPEAARAWGHRLAALLQALLLDPLHREDFRSSTGL
jgi:hypothetical protein